MYIIRSRFSTLEKKNNIRMFVKTQYSLIIYHLSHDFKIPVPICAPSLAA